MSQSSGRSTFTTVETGRTAATRRNSDAASSRRSLRSAQLSKRYSCDTQRCNPNFRRHANLQRHKAPIHDTKQPCSYLGCRCAPGRTDKMNEHTRKIHREKTQMSVVASNNLISVDPSIPLSRYESHNAVDLPALDSDSAYSSASLSSSTSSFEAPSSGVSLATQGYTSNLDGASASSDRNFVYDKTVIMDLEAPTHTFISDNTYDIYGVGAWANSYWDSCVSLPIFQRNYTTDWFSVDMWPGDLDDW